MKNSKTKKLLATITLTSMSFNTSFVLAAPGYNTLEKCYLSNVYQYLQPKDKENFRLINKKCTETEMTGNYINYWCILSAILKRHRQAGDEPNPFQLEWVDDYYFDNPQAIYTADLCRNYTRFISGLHGSTETYRILDTSTIDDLKRALDGIDGLLVDCVVGNFIVIPRGNKISNVKKDDKFPDVDTYAHLSCPRNWVKLRNLVSEYCDTTNPYNFFDCIDFTHSDPARREEVLQHFIDGKYSEALTEPEDKSKVKEEARAYLNKINNETLAYYKNSAEALSYHELKYIRVDSVPDEHKYYFDTQTKTISVCGPVIINKKTVTNIKKQIPVDPTTQEKTKINLLLKNCIVEEGAFRNCNFIDTLTLGNDVTIEDGSFSTAQITNLEVYNGAKIEEYGFRKAKIKKLEVHNGARIENCGFHFATIANLEVQNGTTIESKALLIAKITDSAKYYNTNDNISYDTLSHWGISHKPSSIAEQYFDTISDYAKGTKTLTLGNSDKNSTIVVDKCLVKYIKKRTGAHANKKIHLVLKNCVLEEGAFSGCNFIDTLTLGNGAKIEHGSFSTAQITNLEVHNGAEIETNSFDNAKITNLEVQKGAKLATYSFTDAKITNLEVQKGAYIPPKLFPGAKITNLEVHKGATLEGFSFSGATIENLIVQKDATVAKDGFFGAQITNSAKYNTNDNIPYETLSDWGIIPTTLPIAALYLEQTPCYDENTNTLILGTSDNNRPIVIENCMVQCIKKKTGANAKKKINLVLNNCVVKAETFKDYDFIGTLTLGNGAKIEHDGFLNATITQLEVQNGATIERHGFYGAHIAHLEVHKNAKIKEGGFNYATITNLIVHDGAIFEPPCLFHSATLVDSATSGDGNDIPQETLNTWGLIVRF